MLIIYDPLLDLEETVSKVKRSIFLKITDMLSLHPIQFLL